VRDLFPQLQSWLNDDKPVALATVIKTWGSSPRPVGSGMGVTENGEIAGSVSGGCVESAVIDTALRVLKNGHPERLHFGVGDDLAWEVGLSCGGEIDIFIRKFDHHNLEIWKKALSKMDSVGVALVLKGIEPYLGQDLILESPGSIQTQLPQGVIAALGDLAGEQGIHQIESSEIEEVFIHRIQPSPELILVGGVHIAIPLASLAKTVGFDITVIDPRRLFSTEERFPDIKRLISDWPGKAFKEIEVTESTAIVMLTHDPKIDDPALEIALDSPAFYVGALGSKKTHQKRIERLILAGISPSKLDQIHAPVGLDLGGKTPPEIALGIMAEVLQVWYGKEK